MRRRQAYVLVTCLYVVAVLSLSTLFVMRSASLTAGHARLLEGQDALSREAHRHLDFAEEQAIDPSDLNRSCEQSSDVRIAAQLLHQRTVTGHDSTGEPVDARYSIYGLTACAEGRALMESTVGVLEPSDAFDEGASPSDVATGHLSWRRVW